MNDQRPPQKVVLGSRSHRHLAHSVLLDEGVAPRHIRLTIGLLTAALAGFIAWASVSQLDEVANTSGQIVPSGAVQVVQHQDGGSIARIAVAEGERVKKGQLLLSLDKVETEAELKVSEARFWALSARVARLRAQAEEQPTAADLADIPPAYAELAAEQRGILESHRRATENQEAVIRAQISQLEADLARVKGQIATGEREVRILREVAGIRSQLERDQLVTKVQTLETQRTLVVQEGDLRRLNAQLLATQAQVNEARGRLKSLRSDRRQATLEELGAASAELAQVGELLVKLKRRLSRMDVVAPVDGIVQDLKFRTVGGVIPPGATVMNVVPMEDRLQAEVRIAATDIGHVKVGQIVRVKVLTYDFLRYGTIDGRLVSVSANSFVDERNTPYFKGVVTLEKSYVGTRPDEYPVHPGMTVTCDIVTNRKSVLEYLARPVAVAFTQGLRER